MNTPQTPERKYRVLGNAAIQKIFGAFSYSSNRDGSINIKGSWESDNIVSCTLVQARNGRDVKTRCHRLAKEPFERFYAEVAELGLSKLIHTWDGLFVPRHKTWNVNRDLSSHSWGIAFDVNAETNTFGGRVTSENEALAGVAVKYGMDWGGFWQKKQRDGMHYELVDPNAYQELEAERAVPQLILAIKRSNDHIQYASLESEQFTPGAFTVNTSEISNYLGVNWPEATARRLPVAEVIERLGWSVFQRGDHLADKKSPRYYLFVQKGSKDA